MAIGTQYLIKYHVSSVGPVLDSLVQRSFTYGDDVSFETTFGKEDHMLIARLSYAEGMALPGITSLDDLLALAGAVVPAVAPPAVASSPAIEQLVAIEEAKKIAKVARKK